MKIKVILKSGQIKVQTFLQLFGVQTEEIIEELNEVLAA
jgi:hypothetical protein